MERKYPFNFPRIHTLLFLLIASISLTLISFTFKDIQFNVRADESYYLRYAEFIARNGISGFPILFKDYIANQINWLFPNPLRIVFILISSIWLKVFGGFFISLSYLSLLSFYIFLWVNFRYVRKYFDQNLALLFIILLAFSPLNLAMARRANLESTLNLFLALSIWLLFDLLKERTKLKTALFIFVYALAILIKESAVLLSIAFSIYIFCKRIFFKEPIHFKDFLYVTVFPFTIVGLVYVCAGGLPYTLDIIKIILSSPETNSYAILFGSGPWYRYIIDYLLLSPWIVILTFGFMFYYFSYKNFDKNIFYFVAIFISIFLILNIFTKNVRYVMILDMPMRLFSVLALTILIQKVCLGKKPLFILGSFLAVILIAVFDYLNFFYLFIEKGIYDPVSFFLLEAKQIIPFQ